MSNTSDINNLHRKYGNTASATQHGGEYKTYGSLREVELRIDLTTLTTTPTIINDVTFFPKGCFIEEIVIDAQTAVASSGSGTFDIGLQNLDRSTELDYNGFIAAEVTTNLSAAGKKITYNTGTSKVGALMGTSTSVPGYFTANYTTAVFQTGVIYVRVKYRGAV